MPDIRDVLEQAAPSVSEVDVDRVRRDARRRRALPRVVVGSVAAAALLVGVLVVTQGDDGPGRITSGTTPDSTTSTSEAPTTTTAPTTTSVPPTTTAPPPTIPVGEDRLSTESRLGYAGLGPIKLGMSFDDAVAAARVTEGEPTGCDIFLYGEPGSGVEAVSVWGRPIIDTITVYRPGIRTISGVQVGSSRAEVLATYPSAQADGSSLRITGPAGQTIIFGFVDGDAITQYVGDAVTSMTLVADFALLERHALC